MDRRNFFKIVSTVSAGIATEACGKKSDVLIPLLVRDRDVTPGEEQWHAAVCTGCGAGCGVIARVMEGERVVDRNGQKFRERIASIKKLEGNPLDPVSGGRLCARGQAGLQSLYNPDRLGGPMRRTGKRGEAQFSAITWDEAIASVGDKLSKAGNRTVFITSPHASSRSANIQKFMQALNAPAPVGFSIDSLEPERRAAAAVFGWTGIPRYDLGNARYALGVGADFLGGWAAPVYYGRQFGHFRQGRPGLRGKLVHAESRMSITAQSADEWLPIKVGSEHAFLMAIGRVLIDNKLARNLDQLPGGVEESYASADVTRLSEQCGLDEKRVRRVGRELGESEAPLVIAGASLVQMNSLDALIASHRLNRMLGNVGRAGGVFPPSIPVAAGATPGNIVDAVKQAQVLLLDDAINPVYSLTPFDLSHVETIVSFGMFIDETSAHADFILPSHHALESEIAVVQQVSPASVSIAVTRPFVRPLHNTESLPQILGALAQKASVSFSPVSAAEFIQSSLPPDVTAEEVSGDGGLWYSKDAAASEAVSARAVTLPPRGWVDVHSPEAFPFSFQPYLSLQFHDGRDANLPWMQELPDPASSAMWDLPVEIDPQTASRLNIATGDRVRLQTSHGATLEANAYVHPAGIPGLVRMAVGQGHTHYGRYASNRGANPLSLVAGLWDDSAGAFAFEWTHVNIERLSGAGGFAQFSPKDREQGPWGYR